MKHQDVIERFRKAYQEAYTGILRPEVLEGGNKWFEDFIVQEIDQAIREERERVTAILEERKLTGQFLHDGDVYTPEDINALIGICLQAINQEQ